MSEAPPLLEDEEVERDDAIIGKALRVSFIVFFSMAAVVAAAVLYLSRPEPRPDVAPTEIAAGRVREQSSQDLPTVAFTDVTEQAGLDFVHENGAAGEKLLPETMGGGCAVLDYNGDGRPDILLVNSRRWDWDGRPAPASPPTLKLYRNDGELRFTDVTAEAGLDITLYGMGCAVGDFDNDGDPDLFISAVGQSRLFRNDGGRFVDITGEAGIGGRDTDWTTSCGWFDYDNDGDLDLWVCHYVKWDKETDLRLDFRLVGHGRAYGRPQEFEGTYNALYRNDGDGRFTDVSAEAGIQLNEPRRNAPMAKSLGLVFADFDGDGWMDVVVANDTVQNFLFHNQRDGTFKEVGAVASIAFDVETAGARGAMGIDVGCFREGDECLGVVIGNFANEMSALYVTQPGTLMFQDEAVATGLGPETRLFLSFGTLFVDVDLDGRPDIFHANGHLEDDIALVQASQTYEQAPQLFWNAGPESPTEFVQLGAEQLGLDFLRPLVGRGALCADFDGDGDPDLLITTVGQKPRLLRNDQDLGHHWVRFLLEGTGSNRDAIGARIDVHLKDRRLRHFVSAAKSYLSSSEKAVTVGLGAADVIDHVDIQWPDGSKQTLRDIEVDREHHIVQP
ncbi:MAG: CRTAC1 family protein [Planctomyces sp.]|nr:CRTAC1 family protein [Planctomyces sp.]